MSRYAELVPAAASKAEPAARPRRLAPPPRSALWHVLQLRAAEAARAAPAPHAPSRSGLPHKLKAGLEALSGLAMGDVRVHRNSPAPARFGALAFAKGSDIHLGPGQDSHLPHEAWHVVQQKEGRVRATAQLKGVGINQDAALEAEADRMGSRAAAAGRAEGGRLTRAAAGGGIVQAKLKSGAKWLTPDKGYSAVALDYIGRAESFVLRSNSLPQHAVIHILDASKKYLLGETHESGKWEKDVAGWDVDRMTEGEKAIPDEAEDTAGLFHVAPDRLAQPLESSHAYMLTKTLRAHDHLNLLSWHFRTFTEGGYKYWPTWTDYALEDLDQIVIVFKNYYAPFVDTYDKKYLPSLWDPKKKANRAASPRLAKIYKFAAGLRAHGPDLGKLIAALKKLGGLGKAKAAPPAADFKKDSAEVEANRKFLPGAANDLIAIVAEGDPKQTQQLADLTTASDTFRGADISAAVHPLRERAMAANIKAAAPPLLVQIGNSHLANVAGLVGASAVIVDKDTKFSDITKRP